MDFPETSHLARLNRAFQYIDQHLDQELSLAVVAEEACYSPFHFHRLFTCMTREPLNQYIQRKRIERCANLLINRPDLSVSTLADQYGFSSMSAFSRAFKQYYGMSPSAFRESSPGKFSKVRALNSKNGQVENPFEAYFYNLNENKLWTMNNSTIDIRELPDFSLAYVTHLGPCEGIRQAYEKLMAWAMPLGLMQAPDLRMLTLYHDNPRITEPDKMRMSACMILNSVQPVRGDILSRTLPGGRHVVGRFTISMEEFEQAWTGLFQWTLERGLRPARDKDCFEIYYNDFNQHPQKLSTVDLCIPLQD